MYVIRDLLSTIESTSRLEAALLWGPRQIGKTTLLEQLPLKSKVFLDDLGQRERTQKDPALTLDSLELPCLIDEVQYAPNLFQEIKLRIDLLRRQNLKKNSTIRKTLYFLTGSNRILLDENVKESLAGRCHLYALSGLSVKEILAHFPKMMLKKIMFRGGFPELYKGTEIPIHNYLNDYIISFIEKDIAQSAGIEKLREFTSLLRLLAARTGQFLNFSELANDSNIDQKTVMSWISSLERNLIVKLVPTFYSNLSKRITKMHKLYFYDVGLCARLQSHSDENTLWNSSQVGSLFETIVYSEIEKTKDNFLKDWQIFTWRTKEQKEIDLIIQHGNSFTFIEVKLSIQSAKSFSLDSEARKVFPAPHRKIVVTAGGELITFDKETIAIPIQKLGAFLLENI